MVLGFTVDKAEPSKRAQRKSGANDDSVPDFKLPNLQPPAKKTKLPADAPVQIGLHNFSDDSSLFGFKGRIEPVIAAIYEHAAYPCLTYKESETTDIFCEERHRGDPDFPETAKDMDHRTDMKQVMSSQGAEPPLVPYRRGKYMKLSKVLCFIDFMDTFWNWRQEKALDGDFPPVTIQVHDSTTFNFQTRKKPYESTVEWTKTKTREALPFHVLSIPSVTWMKKYVEIVFETINRTEFHVRFHGDTWSFRTLFASHKIHGRFESKKDGEPLPEDASSADTRDANYVRLIKSIDVESDAHRTFLLEAIRTTLFKGTLVTIEWQGDYTEEDAPTSIFKEQLKLLPNVVEVNSEISLASK